MEASAETPVDTRAAQAIPVELVIQVAQATVVELPLLPTLLPPQLRLPIRGVMPATPAPHSVPSAPPNSVETATNRNSDPSPIAANTAAHIAYFQI